MTEREKLIGTLALLIHANKVKQKQYQEEYGYGPEVGCLTSEAIILMKLMPKMKELGVTLEDCKKETE